MATVQGTRQDSPDEDYIALEMGGYGKTADGDWFMRPPAPGFGVGGLGRHTVVEHEDGTITVSPSILVYGNREGHTWHGYLERGIWREV